MIFSILL